MAVTSHHGRDQMVLHLAGGHLCVILMLHPRPKATLCLSRTYLSDGRWHSVTASRSVLRSASRCLLSSCYEGKAVGGSFMTMRQTYIFPVRKELCTNSIYSSSREMVYISKQTTESWHKLHGKVTLFFYYPTTHHVHSLLLFRYGEWLELQADEGDGPLYNTTSTPTSLRGWTAPLLVDRHEGVHVGGSPEYVGVSLHAVHSDFRDGEIAFDNDPADVFTNYIFQQS